MKFALTVALGFVFATASSAQVFNTTPGNQIFEFTGSSTGDNQFNAISAQPLNAVFSTFTRTTVQWTNAANVFNSDNWAIGGTSIDPTRYTSLTITPNPGQSLNLTSLTFDVLRSGTGPTNGEARYSLDGFQTFNNFQFTAPVVNGTKIWDFVPINTVLPVEFRFYGFGATNSNGAMRFDNVFLTGSASPVPEPGLILASCAAAGLGYRSMRRRFVRS